jgi:hypothetical protein
MHRNSSSECAEKARRTSTSVGDTANLLGSIADSAPSFLASTCHPYLGRTSLRRHPAGSAPRTTTTRLCPQSLLRTPVSRTRQPQVRAEILQSTAFADRYQKAPCDPPNHHVHRLKSFHGRQFYIVRNSVFLFVHSCVPFCRTSGSPSPSLWRIS